MVDTETFLLVLDRYDCVEHTYVSPPGESLRADGHDSHVELELELDPDASDDALDDLADTCRQNDWTLLTDWGTNVWLAFAA